MLNHIWIGNQAARLALAQLGIVFTVIALSLVGCGGGGGGGGSAGAGANEVTPSFAFAANASDSTVSVYTIEDDGTLEHFTYQNVGTSSSRDVVVHPNDRFVYVLGSNRLFAFSVDPRTAELTLINDRPTGSNPKEIALGVNGASAYVSNINDDSISVFSIDLDSGALASIDTVDTGDNPVDLEMHPSGTLLYCVNRFDQSVSVYPVESDGRLGSKSSAYFDVDPLGAITFTSDGMTAYLTVPLSHGLVHRLSVSLPDGSLSTIETTSVNGSGPIEIELDANENFVYVVNGSGNSVTQFSRDPSGALHSPATRTASEDPDNVTFGPDGNMLYVGSLTDADVSVFSIEGGTFEFRDTIRARGGVRGFAVLAGNGTLERDSRRVYVPLRDDREIVVLDRNPSSGRLEDGGSVATGLGSKQIAFHPRRDHAYAISDDAGEIEHFAVDPDSGDLTSEGITILPTDSQANWSRLTIDPAGRFLYALDNRNPLGINGRIAIFVIEDDGSLTASGLQTTSDNPENLVISPGGSHLYVMNSFDDNIRVFEIDPSDGDLSVQQTFTGIDRPLQAVFHPSGRYLYVTVQNEQSVYRFRIQPDGDLDNAQDFQTPSPSQTKAVEIDPTGTSLYVTSADNSLAHWAIDDNGGLSLVTVITDDGSLWLEMSEDGRHMYGAQSDDVAQYELDSLGRPSLVDVFAVPGLGGYQSTITID